MRFYVTCYNVLDHCGLITANKANGVMSRTANLRVASFLGNSRNNSRRVTSHVNYSRVSLLLLFEGPLGPGPGRPSRRTLLHLYSIRGVPITAGVTATRVLVRNLRHNSLS